MAFDEDEEITLSDEQKALLTEEPFGAGVYDDADSGAADRHTGTEAGGETDIMSVEGQSGDETEAEESWVDEGLAAVGQSYGLTPEALKSRFKSADDFRKSVREFEASRSQPVPQPQRTPAAPQPARDEKRPPLDPKWYKEKGFDEETVALVEYAAEMRQQLESHNRYFAQMQQREQMELQQRTEQQFHQAMDEMDEARYGRVRDENGREKPLDLFSLQCRKQLYGVANRIIGDIENEARRNGIAPQFPPLKALLKHAEIVAFPDVASGQAQAAPQSDRREKAIAQAKRRRPVSGTNPGRPEPPSDDMDEVSRIARLPEIQKLWRSATYEYGNEGR